MWICILHLPRHPKTQSAQFTFFTANRFWALGLLGFAFRGSGILRTERVTGPSWDHQFAAKQRPIFERAQRAGSEVSRMIPHDFSWFLMMSHDLSWSLMISHLLVRHLARLECPFSFPNVAWAHAGACLQGRCMTFLNGRSGREGQDAALVKRPSWSRDIQ